MSTPLDAWRARLAFELATRFMERVYHEHYYNQRLSDCLMDDMTLVDMDDPALQVVMESLKISPSLRQEITIGDFMTYLEKARNPLIWDSKNSMAEDLVNGLIELQKNEISIGCVDKIFEYSSGSKISSSIHYASNECHVCPEDEGLGGKSCFIVQFVDYEYDDTFDGIDYYSTHESDPLYISSTLRGAVDGASQTLKRRLTDCIEILHKDIVVLRLQTETSDNDVHKIDWTKVSRGKKSALSYDEIFKFVPKRELERAKRALINRDFNF